MLAALRNFLCRIGIHQWKDIRQSPWTGWSQDVDRRCAHCQKQEFVMFINPISGPRPPIVPEKSKGR